MELKYELEKDLLILVQEWTPNVYVETFHWHSSLEIGCCISGKGRFYFGDKTYDARPGDVFVVNNLERHIAQSDAEDPSRYLFVFFDPLIIEQGERELLLPFVYYPKQFDNRIPASKPVAQQICALIRSMHEEMKERKMAYRTMMRSALLQICALLLRHYGGGTSREQFNRVFNMYRKLQPALTHMKQNFREPLELEDIAQLLNLSPSRTRHLFKETLGEGFKEYLLHLRVNEAKRLLISTDLSITEVCLQSGFQSHTPFYRAFRQIVGMTPQEYRDYASILALFGNDPDEIRRTDG